MQSSSTLETLNNKSEDTVNNSKANLLTQLTELFSISNDSQKSFTFHPFSNEYNWFQNIIRLQDIQPIETNKIRIALLFGESHFLSVLPELSRHADIVILADIEPRLHLHTKHLRACFTNSNLGSFKTAYETNNPVSIPYPEGFDPLTPVRYQIGLFQPRKFGDGDKPWNLAQLFYEMTCGQESTVLGKYHFLSSRDRYEKSKAALNKLSFVNIHLNLADNAKCQLLSELLEKFDAILTVCNFTNIHQYNDEAILKASIGSLLKNSPHCFIMHSDSNTALSAQFSVSLEEYFREAYKRAGLGLASRAPQ